MTITSEVLDGRNIFRLSEIKSRAGLEAVRGAVVKKVGMEPVDGSVITGDSQGPPHAEIVFLQPIDPEIIAQAEITAIGEMATSRVAEINLR
jgi:hypothetical protein